MVNIQDLFDDAKCYQTIRDMRWPDGVTYEATTGMGSARCMSTRSKGSGRCCVPGSVPTGESPRRVCLCTWGSSSSFTTSGPVGKRLLGALIGQLWAPLCNPS